MNILLITQWFQPEDMYKGLPFAKELVKNGHNVEVLTGFPNYPYGKIYDGYKLKLFSSENLDGIKIYRTFLFPRQVYMLHFHPLLIPDHYYHQL